MHTFFLLADIIFCIYSVLIIEAAGAAHFARLQFLLLTVPHKNVFFMWELRFFTGVKIVFK